MFTLVIAAVVFVAIGAVFHRRRKLGEAGCRDCGGPLARAGWWFCCVPCNKQWSLDGAGRVCWQFLGKRYKSDARSALPRAVRRR